jgi:hypothetical protein
MFTTWPKTKTAAHNLNTIFEIRYPILKNTNRRNKKTTSQLDPQAT